MFLGLSNFLGLPYSISRYNLMNVKQEVCLFPYTDAHRITVYSYIAKHSTLVKHANLYEIYTKSIDDCQGREVSGG